MPLIIRGNVMQSRGRVDWLPDANAAQPAMTFVSDPDTGIYRPGDNQLALVTGGTDRLVVHDLGTTITGNVSAAGFAGNAHHLEHIQVENIDGLTTALEDITNNSVTTNIITVNGNVTATGFVGNAHQLEHIQVENIDGLTTALEDITNNSVTTNVLTVDELVASHQTEQGSYHKTWTQAWVSNTGTDKYWKLASIPKSQNQIGLIMDFDLQRVDGVPKSGVFRVIKQFDGTIIPMSDIYGNEPSTGDGGRILLYDNTTEDTFDLYVFIASVSVVRFSMRYRSYWTVYMPSSLTDPPEFTTTAPSGTLLHSTDTDYTIRKLKNAVNINGNATVTQTMTVNGHTIGRGGGSVSTNLAMGYLALLSNTTGFNNSAMGMNALLNNTTGFNNSAMGMNALLNNTTGPDNSAMGLSALLNNTTGFRNSAMGVSALFSNTTGYQNSATGYRALYSNTTGINNNAMGVQALGNNTTGFNNSAVGMQALYFNTTGSYNSAVGLSALFGNTTGFYNSAVGVQALCNNTTGSSNSAVGMQALSNNTTGSNNSAVGMQALHFNTTGVRNSAVGVQALYNNTTGSDNSAVGVQALYNNTTGFNNSAVGRLAMRNNTTGSNNSAVGVDALRYTTSLGSANYTNTSGLGYDTRCSGDNQVQLGDSATTTYAFGAVQNRSDRRDKADIEDEALGLDFLASLRPVTFRWDYRDDYFERMYVSELEDNSIDLPDGTYDVISSNVSIATASVLDGRITVSDQTEYATESDVPISATVDGIVLTLRATQILKKIPKDGSRKRTRIHHGLIAQELEQILVDTGVGDFAGLQHHAKAGGEDVYSIGYTEFVGPLIKAIQQLKAENDMIKARLAALEQNV